MKTFFTFFIITFSSFLIAQEITTNQVQLKVVPPISKTTALYLKIKNNTNKDLKLIKVTSNISDDIEIHEMKMADGKMEMRSLENLLVKSNSEEVLQRGGYHVMIFNLKEKIEAGKKYNFDFFFDNNKSYKVIATGTEFN